MGLTITKEKEERDVVEYELRFKSGPGSWFGFPCDEDGVVDTSKLEPAGLKNFKECQAKGGGEIHCLERIVVEPAEGKCECGRTLVLYGQDQACDCGEMYNPFGQSITRMGYEDLPGEDY